MHGVKWNFKWLWAYNKATDAMGYQAKCKLISEFFVLKYISFLVEWHHFYVKNNINKIIL